jgi:hypothetical protein
VALGNGMWLIVNLAANHVSANKNMAVPDDSVVQIKESYAEPRIGSPR